MEAGAWSRGEGRRSFVDFGLDQTRADEMARAVVVVSRVDIIPRAQLLSVLLRASLLA